MIKPFQNKNPAIHPSVFIADSADIIGDVEIGENSNIWYQTVIRGDVNFIRIGKNTNIQDGTIIHVASNENVTLQEKGVGDGYPTIIGDNVTVGHMALLHACTIGNDCLIGMKACIMDGAVVENNAWVAAGSLVTPGKTVKSGQLWMGSPAKYVRDLTQQDHKMIAWSWRNYVQLAQNS